MLGKEISKMRVPAIILISFAVFIFLAGCTAPQAEFADEKSPVMYFYSDTCHFCIQQKPILKELATEGYRLKTMDVKNNPEYWTEYNIEGTPTFVAGNGDRLKGLQPKDKLRDWLNAHGAKIGGQGTAQ